MKRRTFLARASQAAALSAVPARELLGVNGFSSQLSGTEEETLGAVLDELLAGEPDSPNARELGALSYMLSVLTDPAIEESERQFLAKGVTRLEAFSKERTQQPFAAARGEARGELLRAFVKEGEGESWVSNVLTYCMEAMFGDPIYGINRNEAGWKWIDHHAGFPRPPKRKWYRNL